MTPNLVGVGDPRLLQDDILEINEHVLAIVIKHGIVDPVMTASRFQLAVEDVMALVRAPRPVVKEIASTVGCVVNVGAVVSVCEAFEQFVRTTSAPKNQQVLGILAKLGGLAGMHRHKPGGLGYGQ